MVFVWLIFVAGFFRLAQCPPGSSMLWCVSEFHFFFRLNNIPLYVCTTLCLSIHPSVDTWVASTFWLLWIMLLWTGVCKYLFQSLLSVLWDICPECKPRFASLQSTGSSLCLLSDLINVWNICNNPCNNTQKKIFWLVISKSKGSVRLLSTHPHWMFWLSKGFTKIWFLGTQQKKIFF